MLLLADVEVIGSIFTHWGREIWEPVRNSTIPTHHILIEDEIRFLDQAMELVIAHPYDIVHLSKPRGPNILFGALYKAVWGATVLMDIDDEELAFGNLEGPISLDDYLSNHKRLPSLKYLAAETGPGLL